MQFIEKRKMLVEYNDENLKRVSKIVVDNLTPDLLATTYRKRNSTNPLVGYCHTASGCLQKVFSSKFIKLYRAKDWTDDYHWWNVDIEGNIIDLTADQYYSIGKKPPYEDGEKKGMLGFRYRERVLVLLERVENVLNGKPPTSNLTNFL